MKTFLLNKGRLVLMSIIVLISADMTAQNIPLLPMGSSWRYLDNGTDQGTAWITPAFDDNTWSYGAGQLGFGDGDEATIVSFGPDANNKYTTTYFRTTCIVPDINAFELIKMTLVRDDGAVIYVNGTEVKRANMNAGTVTYQTFAASNSEITETFIIPKTAFVSGVNYVAVEVHQTDLTSSDLSLDMSLEGVVANTAFVVGQGASWKYLDNGTDQGTAWTGAAYDDAAWALSVAPFGYSMTGVVTTVSFGPSSTNKYRTTYFRKTVNATDLSTFDSLRVILRIDDGAVIYINGTEVFRRNMAAGTVTSTTLANATVGSAPAVFTAIIPKDAMITGPNIIAAEVHQAAANSSDLFFDLGIDAYVNDSVLFEAGSNWKYHYNTSAPMSTWNTAGFDDASWNSGNAILGYGNGDETTTLNYTDPLNKPLTAYFRKTFPLLTAGGLKNLELKLKRDDGAIVYLNGTEIYRSNISAGTVTHLTKASSSVEGTAEDVWYTINVPATSLVSGDNTIAVEVHKFNQTESDLRFDLQARLQFDAKTQTAVAPIVTCDPLSSDKIGCFTSVKPSAQTPGFIIPETHTFQMIAQQGAAGLYSNSTRAMPSTHDFTGYVPSNGSSKSGVVSINHENTPGDVSLLSMHLNENTMTWVIDSARLVDFAPLVRTARNCSGGITPWGTVVTSEENTGTGDVNADGYQDVGWQVEIDPVSGKIMDYNGDNIPDKIWAMGRMNHENICIGSDSSVAYQAEDGGTNCVYKYVMSVKGKLNTGTLYVLKRDNPTATTGTWEIVPNSTQTENNNAATLAQSVGGTNWNGPEDIEFGPDGKMYFTSKGTGTIWRFKDDGTTVSAIEAWVTNTNYPITHSEGTNNESFGTGIDNLTFDGEGNLWSMQDGGRGHFWVIRPDHTPAVPHVELFAVTPAGSEPTGLTFTPDYKYGFISIQHPTGSNATILKDAAGNNVKFNLASTIVFARKEFLGPDAVLPLFDMGANPDDCDSVEITANTSSPDILNVWSDNGAVINQRTIKTTGWYKATAYGNNGKTYSDSVYVTIHGHPALDLGSDIAVCVGTPVVLNAGTNSFAYLWNDLSTGNTLSVSTAGEYKVTKTDLSTSCISMDSVEVTINPKPSLELGNDISVCAGTPVTLDAGTNTFTYLWSNLATSHDLSVTTPGEYKVTKTDPSTTCSIKDSVNVTINPLPVVALGTDQVICSTCTALLDAGAGFVSYLWSTAATTQTISVSTSGTYDVTVTDNNGCEGEDAIMITKSTTPTSVEEALSMQNGFVVLQNTQTGGVTVIADLKSASDLHLVLLDVNGHELDVIADASYPAGTHTWELDPVRYNKLSRGIYMARIQSGKKTETRKFILY